MQAGRTLLRPLKLEIRETGSCVQAVDCIVLTFQPLCPMWQALADYRRFRKKFGFFRRPTLFKSCATLRQIPKTLSLFSSNSLGFSTHQRCTALLDEKS